LPRNRERKRLVVPNRIVQHERAVALAPRIARALVLFDHQRGHPEALEPRAQRKPSLAGADDEHLRLDLGPQRVRI
jgi:hypothetical protein